MEPGDLLMESLLNGTRIGQSPRFSFCANSLTAISVFCSSSKRCTSSRALLSERSRDSSSAMRTVNSDFSATRDALSRSTTRLKLTWSPNCCSSVSLTIGPNRSTMPLSNSGSFFSRSATRSRAVSTAAFVLDTRRTEHPSLTCASTTRANVKVFPRARRSPKICHLAPERPPDCGFLVRIETISAFAGKHLRIRNPVTRLCGQQTKHFAGGKQVYLKLPQVNLLQAFFQALE